MRYVRKQISIQVIADEVVDDKNSIRDLLQTFQKAKSDIAITYKKDEMAMPTSHDRVRITLVTETTFDLTVINNMHSMIVRKIPIGNIDYISSTVSPSEVFLKKESITKGDTLDLS